MRSFIKKIKQLFDISNRISLIESQLNELDERLEKNFYEYSVKFEKKLKKMTFAYTSNLDDAKSDYLKRYLENRLDCITNEIRSLPRQFKELPKKLESLEYEINKNKKIELKD